MRRFFFCVFIGLLFIFSTSKSFAQINEEALNFNLPSPDNEIHRSYLGLKKTPDFSLGQINSKVVIIEIFSMYCPICQGEAAKVNTLFDLIQANVEYKDKIKLIGIGAGNSAFEVKFFKNKYTIKFPLFSDGKYTVHKRIGEVRTPYFIGLKLQKNSTFKIFMSRPGKFEDPEKFLKTIIKKSGLKP
jgi:peroxiredoxin